MIERERLPVALSWQASNRFSKVWDQLVAEHGPRRIRLHDLRHTHASILLKANVPVKVVSERLGHSSPRSR